MHPQLSSRRRRLALFSLALGGFAIGIAEFATMGLLPDIARDLVPSYLHHPAPAIAHAGLLITSYAIGVVVGAPIFAAFGARVSHTTLTRWLLALLALGSLASVFMPTLGSMVLFRFLAGLPHGAYFGVASLLAARLMGPGSQGRGIALVMSGLTIANMVGVPISTLLGQHFGWRWMYAIVGILFIAALGLVLLFLPKVPGDPQRSPMRELAAFGNPRVWLMIGVGAIGFGGFFAVYSYIAEVATREVGLAAAAVPWLLATVGLGMTIGNLIGGVIADRSPVRAGVWAMSLTTLACAAYALFTSNAVSLFVLAFLVAGTAQTMGPALQSRLIRVSSEAKLLGASLNHSSFNIGNSLGAWLGGLVIAGGYGYLAPGWVGVALTLAGLLLLLWSLALQRRDRRKNLDTTGIQIQ